MTTQPLSLNPSSITRGLVGVACLVVVASVAVQLVAHLRAGDQVRWLVYLFYINRESNVPTAFATCLLLLAGLLVLLVTALKHSRGEPFVAHWAVLAGGFLAMAADEACSFHERLGVPVREWLGAHNLAIFHFAWVVPAIALVIVLGLFFLNFLLRLPARTASSFLRGAALYLGGALLVETIGGNFARVSGSANFAYSMIATVEESLEMAGVIVFIRALLVYLAEYHGDVHVRFEGRATRLAGDNRLAGAE